MREAPIGSIVPVAYPSGSPESAVITFVWPLWGKAIIFFGIGALLGIPVLIFWLGKKGLINLKKMI